MQVTDQKASPLVSKSCFVKHIEFFGGCSIHFQLNLFSDWIELGKNIVFTPTRSTKLSRDRYMIMNLLLFSYQILFTIIFFRLIQKCQKMSMLPMT